MSFKCDGCRVSQPTGTMPYQTIVATSQCNHPAREYYEDGEKVIDPGGTGPQILKQKNYCKSCKDLFDDYKSMPKA